MSRLFSKASAVFVCNLECLSLRQMQMQLRKVFKNGVVFCSFEVFFKIWLRVTMSSGQIIVYSPAATGGGLENFWKKVPAFRLVCAEKLPASKGISPEIESW